MTILGNRANLWFLFFFLGLLGACMENSPASIEVSDTQGQKNKPDTFRILILGDSLTEGYGVSPNQAYPHLLEQKLNQALSPNEQPYEVVNGGVTGSTTSGGASRIDWYLKQPPEFLIVALGGNDGLRGIPSEKSKENLKSIVVRAQEKKVPVMLAGMKMPPNYGPEYRKTFERMFPELAEELQIPLLPFLLEGVGGNPKMNLPDRIHPNAAGHQIICQTVHKHLIKHLPKLKK